MPCDALPTSPWPEYSHMTTGQFVGKMLMEHLDRVTEELLVTGSHSKVLGPFKGNTQGTLRGVGGTVIGTQRKPELQLQERGIPAEL